MDLRHCGDRCELVFLGTSAQSGSQAGSYVLRIRVDEPADVAFGRFKQGKSIHVARGEYAYVGSALADRGAVSLARRLVRHATRTGERPPHPIRDSMLAHFPSVGLGEGALLPRNGKRRHWNVDHLLDLPQADLAQAFVIRYPVRMEREIARHIELEPQTTILERGLGAHDAPGTTHLLRVYGDDGWWDRLAGKLERLAEHEYGRSNVCHRQKR